MSNNNIYKILETLESLAPKQEPIQQPTKVYESVQPRGSVKEGVSRIEAKLAEAFAAQKQINELSPATLASYDKKSTQDVANRIGGFTQGNEKDFKKIGDRQRGAERLAKRSVQPTEMTESEECPECECTPCECTTNEDTKHTGKYGTEYYKSKDFTGDDEDDKKSKKEPGEKKGRGRPKKAAGEKSSDSLPFSKKNVVGHDLFGRVKATAHDKIKSKGTQIKGKAQSHASNKNESKLAQRFNNVMEGRMIDESGETLSHILNRFKHEVKQFEAGEELSDHLFDALFDYYCDNGEMPYGTAKARDGDPYEWITDRLDQELRTTNEAGPSPTDIKFATPAYQRKASATPGSDDWRIKQTDFDQKEREMPTTRVGLAQRAKDLGISHDSDIQEEHTTMEAELNELAKLAGLKIADEGNEFSGELAKAKMQHKDSFDVDGKEYPVKESKTTLEDIAKLSGIAVEGKDYGDTDFEEPAKLDNTPEEKIEDIDAIVHQGNDLNKEKKQDPKTANKAANPMEAVDPLAAMGRRLMQAYNSIKIQK